MAAHEAMSGASPAKPLPIWHSKASQLVGPRVMHKNGAERETLCGNSKLVCLYFSAHWCPPCHRFTPQLAKFYNEAKSMGQDELEIVFVPYSHPDKVSTETIENHEDYYAQMPWCTLPHGDDHAKALKAKYGEKNCCNLMMRMLIL